MNKVITLAGTGKGGHRDGKRTVAHLYCPRGVTVDGDSNVTVADEGNHRIRKITPQGHVSTLAGTGKEGHRDGEGTVVQFFWPHGIAVDGDGDIIVSDASNHRIRKITPQGHVSTLAGTGEPGHRDGEGAVAQFNMPSRVAVDGSGNIILADRYNHCIRKITPQGPVSTLGCNGEKGFRDGEGIVSQFSNPNGVAVDGDGNIIVVDEGSHRIRKITSQGQVSTLAGNGEEGWRDGEGTGVAQFNCPGGVAMDRDGNVIVADRFNHRIRKITPQGNVSTLAGNGEKGHRDGEGAVVQFKWPCGVAVDGDGNVIVADEHNNLIRKISPQGHVSNLAGNGEEGNVGIECSSGGDLVFSRSSCVFE
jgi:DNA-binding beta-propeller fold protein YncE